MRNPKDNASAPPKDFFHEIVEQKQIYNICASGLVDSVLNGYNGTIFAYGQTGAHTMEGRPDPANQRGIIPHSFHHIFEHMNSANEKNQQYLIRASFLEIYNKEIKNLLSKNPKNSLELKENANSGVYVKDVAGECLCTIALCSVCNGL